MEQVSKVMVLGDSHGDLAFMTAALNLAHRERCNVVHVVGDFGIWTHRQAGVYFLDEVDEEARSLGLLVTFTDGNHENFDHLYAIPVDEDGWRRVRPRIWHAPRGHIWRWGAINFLSMGGAHSIDGPGGPVWWGQSRGPLDRASTFMGMDLPAGTELGNWWPQEVITEEDVQTAIQNMADWADGFNPHQEIDVMFAHDAPSGISLPAKYQGYPAADANRELLQRVYEVAQPQLLVHGHYHSHFTYDDRRMNCMSVSLSHNESQGGQYMFIDTDPFEVTLPTWRTS